MATAAALEPKDAEAIAKLLASLNVVDRDRRKRDEEGPPPEPEEILETLAKAIGPEKLVKLARQMAKGGMG